MDCELRATSLFLELFQRILERRVSIKNLLERPGDPLHQDVGQRRDFDRDLSPPRGLSASSSHACLARAPCAAEGRCGGGCDAARHAAPSGPPATRRRSLRRVAAVPRSKRIGALAHVTWHHTNVKKVRECVTSPHWILSFTYYLDTLR